jgi:hypothetical protein
MYGTLYTCTVLYSNAQFTMYKFVVDNDKIPPPPPTPILFHLGRRPAGPVRVEM